MKVLVTGAGGFLGGHVVQKLLERGHQVRAIVRPASPAPKWPVGDVDLFPADLRVHNDLKSAFEGIDAVVHVAAGTRGSEDAQFASTVVATERLLDAMARSPVRRLVHISSLVVYDWARAKSVLDETTPLLSEIYDMGGYTIAKVWQERVVSKMAAANSWDLTILRPGFIWGADHADIAGMGRHIGRVYLMLGPFTRLPLSHVNNCADCIAVTLTTPAAIGKTFNIVDDDDIRVWRYVREYSKGTGQRGVMLPIPYYIGFAITQMAFLTKAILFGKKGKLPSLLTPRRFEAQFKPVRFSTERLKAVLNWTPPLSFHDRLEQTYGPTRSSYS